MLNKIKELNNMKSELDTMMTRQDDILVDFEIRTKNTVKYKKACKIVQNYVTNFALTKEPSARMISSMCFMNDSQTVCLGYQGNTTDLSDLYKSIESLGDFYMKGCAVGNPNHTFTEEDLEQANMQTA
jgi:hypothetical protein